MLWRRISRVENQNTTSAPLFQPGETTVIHSVAQMSRVGKTLRNTGRPVVLVPTMGALHEGHLELIRAAQTLPRAVVVVSVFVNPLQFGEGEDFEAYPRTLDEDVAKIREVGAELVFAPTASDMYPNGFRTTVAASELSTELEGASRPGHFNGAMTVVNKLFNITHCTDAIFGEKDYQQLVLMQQMVTDLNLPVQLHAIPVIRERDGLAMSSRNRYLSADERESAVTLSAALTAGAYVGAQGAQAVLDTAWAVLNERPEVQVDYLVLRDMQLRELPSQSTTGAESTDSTATPATPIEARLLVAAKVGTTRLLDNVGVILGAEDERSQAEREQKEIAQAALDAAGLGDEPLTEVEMAQIKQLHEQVQQVRKDRLARQKLGEAGFSE